MSNPPPPTRSGAEIVVKLLTVHIMTAANYAYMNAIRRRKLSGWLDMVRVIFFIFTPTFLVIEFVVNSISAIVNLVRDDVNEKETSLWYTISAALGSHAVSQQRDESPLGADRLPARKHVPLTEASYSQCNRNKAPSDWAWIGKIVVCIFTLTQGVGTVANWVQRILWQLHSPSWGLDDRVGSMGVVTIIISLQTLVLLLGRTDWTVNHAPTRVPDNDTSKPVRIFIGWSLVAILAQEFTRVRNYRGGGRHSSFFILAFVRSRSVDFEWKISFSLILLIVFIAIFIHQSTNYEGSTAQLFLRRRLSNKARKRLVKYLYIGIVVFVSFVLVLKVVQDVLEIVKARPGDENWRQTPLSEIIPVFVINSNHRRHCKPSRLQQNSPQMG